MKADKTYKVSGMHCRSCELLIEAEVKKLPGVKGVKASLKEGSIEVAGSEIDDAKVEAAVKKLGYSFGEPKGGVFSKNLEDYKILITAFLLLVAAIFLFRTIGFDRLFTGVGLSNSSLPMVLAVGLVAGVSSCMALVGGLVLGISARYNEEHPDSSVVQKFRPHIFFNLGRVFFYFMLGGIAGSIGSALKPSGGIVGVMTVVVGIFMLFLGVQLSEIFPKFSNALTLPKNLASLFGFDKKSATEYSHRNAFILGGLTFFLPCGFTQAMQVLAVASGNFLAGALIMATFAIGTIPGLLGIGGMVSLTNKGYFSKLFFKFVALTLILLAFFNLSNGFNLLGVKLPSSTVQQNQGQSVADVKVENGIQIVKMTQGQFGYSPNLMTVKKGVTVRWVITSTTQATCASSIYIPSMNIEKILTNGENVIEFTPIKAGLLQFSCSMGMYRGTFNVTE